MQSFEDFMRNHTGESLSLDEAVITFDVLKASITFENDPVGWILNQPNLIEFLKTGKTISAIKELRIVRGLSLLEAKNLIDEARMHWRCHGCALSL